MANNRSKKARKSLDLRQKAYDSSGNKPGDGTKRPGSRSGRK